jgi:UDP-N-acetyl-2-amino-2-deoxyglucuronate dehydrogenase
MTIKIGLIGGGNITETHARAVMAIPGLEIAAIQGTNAAKVTELSRQYGGKAYQDFEAFLGHQPMALVIIGSPSGLHATQGIAAAHRGLHVLTEKPIDVSLERTDQLIATAERAGVKLGVIFQDRVKPAIRLLKQWLQDGILGKPLFVDAGVKWYRPPEYYANSRWRGTLALDGGGAVINQAIHTLDLMLWLFGDVSRVQAHKATILHAIEAEDTATALFEFASGTLGVFQATTAAYPGYPRRLEITGTEGTVILEHDRIVSVGLRKVAEECSLNVAGDGNQSASSAAVTDVRGHQAVIEDFVEAIRQDRQPLCDGKEGRKSLTLVQAIYRAAEGRCGTVPE